MGVCVLACECMCTCVWVYVCECICEHVRIIYVGVSVCRHVFWHVYRDVCGHVCGRVYGHVWQCEGMSGCYYCIYMSHIFCKTVMQVEGGGVVKSASFKSISAWFKPTWFKAHCDHCLKKKFLCLRCD